MTVNTSNTNGTDEFELDDPEVVTAAEFHGDRGTIGRHCCEDPADHTNDCKDAKARIEEYAAKIRSDGEGMNLDGKTRITDRLVHKLSVEGRFWSEIEDLLNGNVNNVDSWKKTTRRDMRLNENGSALHGHVAGPRSIEIAARGS